MKTLEWLKENALIAGWVFLTLGWIVFFADSITGTRPVIPLVLSGISLVIFVYDLVRNKL